MVAGHSKRGALAHRHPAKAAAGSSAAAVLPDGNIALKGPVARKTVEAFYFASKPYALLHKGSGGKWCATLPKHSIWAPARERCGGAPDAAVLWLWYPEVKTLVAAYAGGRALEAEVATVSDDFATPFYLPHSWGATARQPYASAFNRLHGAPALVDGKPGDDNIQQAEKALHDSHSKLQALTGKQSPLRVLVTGYSAGGALATIAAPWLALAYPSAEVRLINFGAPFVNSRSLSQLAEWSVGIRLRAVLKDDPALAGSTSCAAPGLDMSPVVLSSTGTHTLAAYTVAVATFFQVDQPLETSGTGFAPSQYAKGSFWGDDDFARQLLAASSAVQKGASADAEAIAVEQAMKFSVAGSGARTWHEAIWQGCQWSQRNGVGAKSSVASPGDEPGYVAAPFELVPGAEGMLTLDDTMQRLVARTLVQPMRYARCAYAAEVIPDEFIETARFPLSVGPTSPQAELQSVPNVVLVSDPLSGADAYVCYHEPTGTAQLIFRGTEPYSLDDITADLEWFHIKANLTLSPAEPAGLWARVKALPGQALALVDSALATGYLPCKAAAVHRGFLGQFQALAGGGDDWNSGDLLSAMGWVRAGRAVLRTLLPRNSGDPPKDCRRNLAAVLSRMTGGRAPLRVLCTGHSLGGALATIASQWAALTFPDADVRCVTFGSPLVGNAEFVAAWRAVVGTRIRAVHAYDIVPCLPPSRVGPIHTGFVHVYPAVWLRPRGPSLELHDVQLERPVFNPADQDLLVEIYCRLPRNIHNHMMQDGYCATLGKVLGNMGLEEESL